MMHSALHTLGIGTGLTISPLQRNVVVARPNRLDQAAKLGLLFEPPRGHSWRDGQRACLAGVEHEHGFLAFFTAMPLADAALDERPVGLVDRSCGRR